MTNESAPCDALSVEAALSTLKAMLRGETEVDLDVVERIDEYFRALPDEQVSIDIVEGLLNVQLLFYDHELYRRAVPSGMKAVRWARLLGDRPLLAKALTFRSALAGENHDLSVAFEAQIEALQIGRDIQDVFRVSTCYCNLGALLHQVGRDRTAMRCLEAALDHCGEMESTAGAKVTSVAMTTMSELYLRRGEWHAARRSAAKAYESFNRVQSLMSICAQAICNEVEACVRLRDFDGASQAIARLSQLNTQHPSTVTENYLRQSGAIFESATGNSAEAIETLTDLLQSPTLRENALRQLIDIHERLGEPEKALALTRNLLSDLRLVRREVTDADIKRIDVASEDDDDADVRQLIARSARFEIQASTLSQKTQAKLAYLFELAVNAELAEEDERSAGQHIYRVGRLCAALAVEAGYPKDLCWLAEVAGRVHDVGKTSLPSHVVLKTSQLTDGERAIIRVHAEDGALLVAQIGEPSLIQVIAAVRHHHERWDGSGYPKSLRGEEIPLLARIVAICESFDAMTHSRPYRAGKSIEAGLSEIERCAGTQFDPHLAGTFVTIVRRMRQQHGELDEYLGEPGRNTRWAKSQPLLMQLLAK